MQIFRKTSILKSKEKNLLPRLSGMDGFYCSQHTRWFGQVSGTCLWISRELGLTDCPPHSPSPCREPITRSSYCLTRAAWACRKWWLVGGKTLRKGRGGLWVCHSFPVDPLNTFRSQKKIYQQRPGQPHIRCLYQEDTPILSVWPLSGVAYKLKCEGWGGFRMCKGQEATEYFLERNHFYHSSCIQQWLLSKEKIK